MRLLALFALFLLAAAPAHAQLKNGRVVVSCGAPTLTPGPVDQVTQDQTGRLCMGEVAFGGPCAAATNYLARTTGGNEGGNSAAVTALICGLVADGLITGTLAGAAGCGTYLDGLYILAQQNVADAKLNLCGTSYTLTVDAATLFAAYVGFHNFPNAGMDTGYNVSTAVGRKWAQNSAGMGIWMLSVVVDGVSYVGSTPGSGTNAALFPSFTGNFFYGRVNNNSSPPMNPGPLQGGLYAAERADAANDHLFFNGIDEGLKAAASIAPDNGDLWFGKLASSGSTGAQTLCAGYMGAPLGAVRQLALYNRLRTYMTAVGVP